MNPENKKPVRFYFCVDIACLIPPHPGKKRVSVHTQEWAKQCLNEVEKIIRNELSVEVFSVAYRKHELINAATQIYDAEFIISALHYFSPNEIFSPRENYGGFRVRARPLLKTIKVLQSKIADKLSKFYHLKNITYQYHASRFFGWEIYFGGFLTIKHFISDAEVRDVGGSVAGAIDQFESQVNDVLEEVGWTGSCKTRKRRKDGAFQFEVAATRIFSFAEDQIVGDVANLTSDMSSEEATELGIDFRDENIAIFTDSEKFVLQEMVEQYFNVVELDVGFVDYDEEIYDISEEILR